MMDESFLTTEEVLEYLQVNLRTVYRLIKAGKIPAVRVGRQWRFRKRDIDAWLDSQRSAGGGAAAAAATAPQPPGPHPRRRLAARRWRGAARRHSDATLWGTRATRKRVGGRQGRTPPPPPVRGELFDAGI